MDTDVLVERRIDEGRRLLKELERESFDVTLAMWVKPSSDGRWRLYIASKTEELPGGVGFYTLLTVYRRLLAPTLTIEDVYLVRSGDRMAEDGLKIRKAEPKLGPIWATDLVLGNRPIDAAYIYPAGPIRLTPEDATLRMFQLLRQQSSARPAMVSLRDGSSFYGLPCAMHLGKGGPADLEFVDSSSHARRSFKAEEVVGID